MSEITDKVAQLEATEKQLQAKQTELAASTASVEEKQKQKAAMDAELLRVQTDITTAKEERRTKDATFQEKLRGENLETAKAKFFTEFKYVEPEDQNKFLESFKQYDSQSVNPELIYNDMLKAHVASNPAKYIELERTAARLKEGGIDFTTAAAGSAFDGAGALPVDNTSGLSADDMRAAQWAGIPVETYKRLKSEGKIE
jgi:hypothetical protein